MFVCFNFSWRRARESETSFQRSLDAYRSKAAENGAIDIWFWMGFTRTEKAEFRLWRRKSGGRWKHMGGFSSSLARSVP